MSVQIDFHSLFFKGLSDSSSQFCHQLEACSAAWTGLSADTQRDIFSAIQSAFLRYKLEYGSLPYEDEGEVSFSEVFDPLFSRLIVYSSLDSDEIPSIISTVQNTAEIVLKHLDPSQQIATLEGPDEINFAINMRWLTRHGGPGLKEILERSPKRSLDLSSLGSPDFRSVASALVNHKAVFEAESLVDFRKVLNIVEDYELTFLEPAIRQYLCDEAKTFLSEGNGKELIDLYLALIPHLNNPESCLQVAPLLQTIWDCVLGAAPDSEIFNLESCSFVLSTMLHADSKGILDIEALKIQNLISAMAKQHGLETTATRLEDSLKGLEDADEVIDQVQKMFQSATCVAEGMRWETHETQETQCLIIDIDSVDAGLKMYDVAQKLFHHPLLELHALLFSEGQIEIRVNTVEGYPEGQNQSNLNFIYYHLSTQAQELKDPKHCRVLFNSNSFWKSHQDSEKKYDNVALYTPSVE